MAGVIPEIPSIFSPAPSAHVSISHRINTESAGRIDARLSAPHPTRVAFLSLFHASLTFWRKRSVKAFVEYFTLAFNVKYPLAITKEGVADLNVFGAERMSAVTVEVKGRRKTVIVVVIKNVLYQDIPEKSAVGLGHTLILRRKDIIDLVIGVYIPEITVFKSHVRNDHTALVLVQIRRVDIVNLSERAFALQAVAGLPDTYQGVGRVADF